MTAAYLPSFTLPDVNVGAPALAVNRGVVGNPPTEVITSLVLTQTISVTDTIENLAARGFSSFTWTWTPAPGTETADLATALTAAGWDRQQPALDPTKTYVLSLNPTS